MEKTNLPPKLTSAEIGRKGYHLLGLLIPLIYLYNDISRTTAMLVIGCLWVVAVIFDTVRLSIPSFNAFSLRSMRGLLRQGESHQLNGMVYYMLAAFLVIWWWDKELASISLIFLVVGDTAAALVGIPLGRSKIWGGKSLQGSLACLVSVWLVALLFLSPERALVAAIVSTLVESLPTTVILNDNLWIPVATSAAIALSFWLW